MRNFNTEMLYVVSLSSDGKRVTQAYGKSYCLVKEGALYILDLDSPIGQERACLAKGVWVSFYYS